MLTTLSFRYYGHTDYIDTSNMSARIKISQKKFKQRILDLKKKPPFFQTILTICVKIRFNEREFTWNLFTLLKCINAIHWINIILIFSITKL